MLDNRVGTGPLRQNLNLLGPRCLGQRKHLQVIEWNYGIIVSDVESRFFFTRYSFPAKKIFLFVK